MSPNIHLKMVYLPSTACVCGIYGSLGGGKTLTAVDIAIWFIRNFHTVISNVRLKNLSKREEAYYTFIPDISRVDWHKLPHGSPRGSGGRKRVAVILDELPELLDQYANGKDYWVQSFLSWLRMTSKQGQFVFVISQDPSFILKPVRLLCAYWIKCEDMSEFRLPFLRIKLPFFRDLISRRTYNRDKTCINGSLNTARKSVIGKYYDTAQGLSRFSPASVSIASDPFSLFVHRENLYRRLLIFSSFSFVFSIVAFLFLFLGTW